MNDLGKAVVEPEVKGMWGGESRWGDETTFGQKRRDMIQIRILSV